MKRRNFIKKIPVMAGLPFMLNGMSFNQLSAYPTLKKLAKASTNNKVMVIIQLHGGNDGLNAVIPINQYAQYYNLRPNIAIPSTGARKFINFDNTLGDNKLIGLHPDMMSFKELYDKGRLSIVQNVGYENMNGSHFKGRDIWFGGADYDDPITSGWMGRYLELAYEQDGKLYPEDFPNEDMPDPLGLEFGNEVSLGFHTEETIPAGISIDNPEAFYNLINDLDGYNEEDNIDKIGIPPDVLNNSLYKKEIDWILNLEKDTDKYAERLAYVYGQATNSELVTYPEKYPLTAPNGVLKNPLSGALRIIARLVQGGCMTKIYLVRIGGFDTHVNQVESYDNSLGLHAALLYHVSAAMKAFQDDLKARGVEDQVLTCTMSEFGRRAQSNGSYGCDHGTVAPMFVMGKGVNPGIVGNNTDLSAVKNGNLSDELGHFIDYRDVFTEILTQWFELPPANITQVFPGYVANGLESPLIGNITALNEFVKRRFNLKECFPNPVREKATFSFYIDNPAHIKFGLYDMKGQLVKVLMNEFKPFGEHQVTFDFSDLRSGTYIYSIEAGLLKDSKKMIKL